MIRTLQKLGRSLMLPVACLPVAAILMGIGYWLDPVGKGENSIAALFLIEAGDAVIANIGFLFAIGVSVGMAVQSDGTAALSSLVSILMVLTLLSVDSVALFQGVSPEQVHPAFEKINPGNQFVGILCGLIGAFCYNRFKDVKLPDALSFFSGKRCVTILSSGVTLVATLALYILWPTVYTALTALGEAILSTGPVGAGLYAFFNRLVLPFGLHHALNSVFWFDVAGISDIGKFWGTVEGGVPGTTGMYLTGFFPIMMFGVPGGALAMYRTAHTAKRKAIAGLMLSTAFASFFTGITEPFEFSFMFLTPLLYLVHALLTALSVAVCAMLPVRSGFNFSAGFVDWILSFRAPMAQNPLLILPIGLVMFVVYYTLFRFIILRFDLKTPGREDDEAYRREADIVLDIHDYPAMARGILEGLGGADNISSVDSCVSRLRVEVRRHEAVRERKLKAAGAVGVIRPGKTSVQIVIGTNVQFVSDELNRLLKNNSMKIKQKPLDR
jgi:PTS system N-acetylglucosamine-specific IIC component